MHERIGLCSLCMLLGLHSFCCFALLLCLVQLQPYSFCFLVFYFVCHVWLLSPRSLFFSNERQGVDAERRGCGRNWEE